MGVSGMSFDEKRAWIYAGIATGLPLVYFATVLNQLATTSVENIFYARQMLIVIGAAIILNIVLNVVAALFWSKDGDRRDERDTSIERYGEYYAGVVVGVAMVVPLGLTLAEADHFWIAQAMYLAFVLSALVSSIVKISSYRRGFRPA